MEPCRPAVPCGLFAAMGTYGERRPRPFARLLDGIGYGVGSAAGGVALLLLWAFDVVKSMRGGLGEA